MKHPVLPPPPLRSRIRALPPRRDRYDRRRDLQRLIPIWPAEIADASYAGRLALLAKLRKALRNERKRGASGHWSYDLGRHAALRTAYRAEVAAARACKPRLHSDPALVNGCAVSEWPARPDTGLDQEMRL
jgi:hypothetical protein